MIEFNKIHEDARGQIFLLTGLFPEDKEVTLFLTKKGYARGGCIHRKNAEYCCVLDGEIVYYVEGQTFIIHLFKGDTYLIEKGRQHYFVSSTDSTVIEWGATPEEKKKKGIWRSFVDEINGRIK